MRDRLTGLSLTEVAKKHRISRTTVCRLVDESRRMKKARILEEKEVPLRLASNSLRPEPLHEYA